MWSIFPYADLPSIHLLLGSVCLGLLPLLFFLIRLLLFLLLSVQSSLYILGNSHLTYLPFANIFSQFVACLLVKDLLTVRFEEPKSLISLSSPYLFFTIVPMQQAIAILRFA